MKGIYKEGITRNSC